MPPEGRFWPKVEKTPTCWLWTAGTDGWGYGVFRVYARPMKAHRFAYELEVGPIPEGHIVCHACDVPACVRPDHLFLGTNADNNRDMREKGRQRHLAGEDHWTRKIPSRAARGDRMAAAKLTDDQVREMRARYAAGGVSQQALAGAFGIHQTIVSRIVRRKAWRHID